MILTVDAPRILDFDIEARPLSWYGGDFVTKEITAIAARFLDEDRTRVWVVTTRQGSYRRMLQGFLRVYNEADIVTGHFIRGYDLPVINGALLEVGMPALGDKLTQDTKLDLVKRSGLSVSQENLSAMLGLVHPKVRMTQADWREANRLTRSGIAKTKARVVGDVEQHIELRERLLELHMLKAPSVWTSKSLGVGNYHA